jgi:Fungal specific transcription factor domain
MAVGLAVLASRSKTLIRNRYRRHYIEVHCTPPFARLARSLPFSLQYPSQNGLWTNKLINQVGQARFVPLNPITRHPRACRQLRRSSVEQRASGVARTVGIPASIRHDSPFLYRANKKKCSEERPACAYCIRTGHASTCTVINPRLPPVADHIQYEGLQSLIRFEWCSADTEESPQQKSPKPTGIIPTPPESHQQSPSITTISSPALSFPSPPAISITSPSTTGNEEDQVDETILQLAETARQEAFHLVRFWPLSNGTGYETQDLPYVHFFMNQMGNYLWFAGITQPVSRYIMNKALEEPVLQHAVLCTSAALLSERTMTGPSRYLEHKQRALALLRHHIDNLEINESVAAAIFFLLFTDIGEVEARSHLRGLKSVLDYLKKNTTVKSKQKPAAIEASPVVATEGDTQVERLPDPQLENPDITGLSPLAWLIWAWGIRMDIAMATIDGAPMIGPLPTTPESESFHRSWISQLSDPTIPDSAEWALANFILDNIMHRGCHVARKARVIRSSPNYTPQHETKIRKMCQQIGEELERWKSRKVMADAKLEEERRQALTEAPPECCFLHHPPVVIHNGFYRYLSMDYHCAKLYLSLVEHPFPGPNPPGSGRYQHAVDICRILSAKPLFERNDVRGAEEAMCLFLAGLVFGGDEYYPMESRWVENAFQQYFPIFTGTTPEHLVGIWLENCPCVPMVKEKNFPWALLGSLGVPTTAAAPTQFDASQFQFDFANQFDGTNQFNGSDQFDSSTQFEGTGQFEGGNQFESLNQFEDTQYDTGMVY